MSEMTPKPDLQAAERAAWEMLRQTGADRFPVRISGIFKALEQYVTVLKWTEARRVLDTPDPFGLKKAKADARCEKSRAGGPFMIVYDDTEENTARVRFTLMHETGHILLGHLNGEAGASHGLTDAEYDRLEKEADRFAAEVLCPSPFFRHFEHMDAARLKSLCHISGGCADRQARAILRRREMPEDAWDRELLRQFYDAYMKTPQSLTEPECDHRLLKEDILPRSRVCGQCGAYIPGARDRYCSCCGARHRENSATVGHVPFMLREKPRCCPNCLNDDVGDEDRYCMICGQPRQNLCLNEGRWVPYGARYCPVCGGETAYREIYRRADKIRDRMNNYRENSRWQEYAHTDYARYRAEKLDDPGLYAALMYSRILTDEDGRLLVLTPNAKAREDVIRQSGDLLSICGEYGARHPAIGVYSTTDEAVPER